MKIKYFGHSCFALNYENGAVLVTDPFDESVTYAPCTIECDAALVSHDHFDHNHVQSLSGEFAVIKTAGKHEVKGIQITATLAHHDPEQGALRGENLLMRVEGDGLAIAHLGDLGHMPNEEQLAALAGLDVLMLPIGGTYTIDTLQAEELVKQLKPRKVIAMHFRTEDYGDCFVTCEQFAQDMKAQCMPCEIEVTRDNIDTLPDVMILAYK